MLATVIKLIQINTTQLTYLISFVFYAFKLFSVLDFHEECCHIQMCFKIQYDFLREIHN